MRSSDSALECCGAVAALHFGIMQIIQVQKLVVFKQKTSSNRLPIVNGAPLDWIKLVAALATLFDHLNAVLLAYQAPAMWWFGRLAFPLFCYVAACHVQRQGNSSRYIGWLLVVGIFAQPAYDLALNKETANILITLACGVALASAIKDVKSVLANVILSAGAALVTAIPDTNLSGFDFGFAGVLFPAAILVLFRGGIWQFAQFFVLLFALNFPAENFPAEGTHFLLGSAPADGLAIACFVAASMIGVILAANLSEGFERFLDKRILYILYPAHLFFFGLLRAIFLPA
jgi:TraX protein